jgi:hypothetical protein
MKRPISVTPVETGVQRIYDDLKRLDSGACPGPDPGFAGMTKNRISGFFTKPSKIQSEKFKFIGTGIKRRCNYG